MATALATPDLSTSYSTAASELAGQPLASTAAYESPYTMSSTGELQGTPQAKEGSSYLTPASTVAGQIESLIKSDSPLQQQATTRAKEQASALGMSASSMAIRAGQQALYDYAVPIAQQDAQTAANFQAAKQAVDNEQIKIETEAQVAGSLNQQKAQLAEQAQNIQNQWQTTLKGLDQQSQAALVGYQAGLESELEQQKSASAIALAEKQAKLQTDLTYVQADLQQKQTKLQSDLELNLQTQLAQQKIDAATQQQVMTQAQDMLNNYQITVQQLLGNQVFLDSMPDAAAMHQVFNDMFATVSSSIAFSTKAAGAYTPTIDTAIQELIAANTW